ncbi:MAG: DUF1653 domain-containing protein [Clostridia bacterium]|nr:DUF1653 domain-containing protein [Clostridia bacterium]
MNIKAGDLCKHFKGNSLIEKNIYEIIAVDVIYTGEGANKLLDNLVVYKNLFQEGKIFTREYDDLIGELSEEKQKQWDQKHRIEKLTEDEIKIVKSEQFIKEKLEYMEKAR